MWHGDDDDEYNYEENEEANLLEGKFSNGMKTIGEYMREKDLAIQISKALEGIPDRQNIISKDEALNVKILVNSVNDVNEFLNKM